MRAAALAALLTLACAGRAPAQAAGAQSVRELSLAEVLLASEKAAPSLQAAQEVQQQATESVRIAESNYLPTIDFGAVQSYGFSGGTASNVGMQGLMASPYHSGPAGGLFSQMTLFDLQREYGLKVSRERLRSAEERKRLQRLQVDLQALGVFLSAALDRSQWEAWHRVGEQTQKVADIVRKFTRSGQHSVVSLWLVEDQKRTSDISEATYQEQYQASLQRLALLSGLQAQGIACPSLAALSEKDVEAIVPGRSSPFVETARADADAAHAQASVAFAANFPRLLAAASVGDMSASKAVSINSKGVASFSPKQDYTGGFGFVLPLFAGDRIDSDVKRARHAALEKDRELEDAELGLADANVRFDEQIGTARTQLTLLAEEDDAALKTLDQATKRYLSFIGTLVDVREAIRNLARIETDLNTAKAQLILAEASKALVNGGAVAP